MSTKSTSKATIIVSTFSYALILLLMILVYFVSTNYQIPFKEITGDPALTFGAHPFTGIISNIGVLLWSATCAILLFTFLLFQKTGSGQNSLFLLCSGIITGILLIDDLFMLHDYIFYSIGLNQYVMYSLYLIIFIAYFTFFRNSLIKMPNKILLILAFIFLGSSVGLDIVLKSEGIQYFFEDGLKLFGITSWFLFYISYCLFLVKSKTKE